MPYNKVRKMDREARGKKQGGRDDLTPVLFCYALPVTIPSLAPKIEGVNSKFFEGGVVRLQNKLLLLLYGWTILAELFCLYLRQTQKEPPVYLIYGYTDENCVGCALEEGWYAFEYEWMISRPWKFMYGSVTITALAIIPEPILIGIALVLLVKAAVSDWKTRYVGEGNILLIMLICLSLGFRSGRIAISLIAAVLVCLYEILLHDSAIFGGADFYILMGLLSYLGFCAWDICLLLACIIGILTKVVMWATEKEDPADHGIAYVPSICAGAVLAKLIDLKWGYIYAIKLSDLLYLLNG